MIEPLEPTIEGIVIPNVLPVPLPEEITAQKAHVLRSPRVCTCNQPDSRHTDDCEMRVRNWNRVDFNGFPPVPEPEEITAQKAHVAAARKAHDDLYGDKTEFPNLDRYLISLGQFYAGFSLGVEHAKNSAK